MRALQPRGRRGGELQHSRVGRGSLIHPLPGNTIFSCFPVGVVSNGMYKFEPSPNTPRDYLQDPRPYIVERLTLIQRPAAVLSVSGTI